eukprot:scaffold50743_cov19-Tisochrysis_lutea.AAC.1
MAAMALEAPGNEPPPAQMTRAWKAGFEARMALASVITNMAKVGPSRVNAWVCLGSRSGFDCESQAVVSLDLGKQVHYLDQGAYILEGKHNALEGDVHAVHPHHVMGMGCFPITTPLGIVMD